MRSHLPLNLEESQKKLIARALKLVSSRIRESDDGTHDTASRFWRELVVRPRGAIGLARSGDRVDGVVVLAPSWAPNQTHRADAAKLLVHRRARGAGLGRRLMTALTDHARAMFYKRLTQAPE